ncbi:uncharacterized protein LOC124150011 [Haliotis rufescens]|uniref:uncharacterized protein LOC124150011 n=1 Tax=Haliotis rufescens TaxID=6454 RepID=UPI00201F80A6|nr:uncharacterized protein LOC124150011 [Haliotis rufescens]
MTSLCPVLLLMLVLLALVSCQQKICNKDLGMASGEIPDSGILVSSELVNHEKEKMRFGSFENVSGSAWCPNFDDGDPWVEIHLPKVKSVSQIKFQLPALGNPPTTPAAFMTKFNMEFLPYFGDEKYILFKENIKSVFNATLSYAIIFDPAIVTNTIKLTPTEWTNAACFRMEIIGCDITDLCPDPYCLNDGVCAGSNLCYCPQSTLVGEKCQYTKPCVPVTMYNFTEVVNGTVTGVPADFKVIKGEAMVEGGCSPLLHLHKGGCVQMPLDALCFKDLDNCYSGFTISLSVKQNTIVDPKYFLTTGGELGSHSGIAFYYQNQKLIVSVIMSKRSWRLVKQFTPQPNTWYWFEISWTPNFGLSLNVNGLPAGYVFQYSTADPTGNKSETLVVGCSTQVTTAPNTLWVKNLVFAPLRHEDLNGTLYYNYAGGLTNATPCIPPPTVMECMDPPTTTKQITTTEIKTTIEVDTTIAEADTTTQEADTTTQEADTTIQEADTTTQEADTTIQEAETTTQEADTTTQEADTTIQEADTTTQEAETTTQEADATTQEAETTTQEADTTTQEADTTTQEAETTTEEIQITTEVEPTQPDTTETSTNVVTYQLTEATTIPEELTTEEPTTPMEEIRTTAELTTEELSTETWTTTETTTTTTTTLPTTEIRCQTPLWQTGIIKDVHVVSSSNAPGKTAILAKSECCPGPTVGGWCPDPKLLPTAQYLEVSFEKPYGVKAIEIQPPEGTDPIFPSPVREYMTNYTFQYVPYGGSNLTTYGTQAGPIYMLGVRGTPVTVVSTITEIIGLVTEKVRISIADFKNEPCFRFELFGCEPQYLCKPMCENGGTCIYENTCACPPPFYGPGCKYTHLPPASGCLQPLGMWNGTIKDSQLVASSSSLNNGKNKARYLCCFGETKGAWCPDKDDRAPYYEVHLNKPYLVAMIMFEHPNTLNYWEVPDRFLNTFTLQYRNVYQDAMETYAVNIDAIYNSSISLSPLFDPFILTDVIRIVPSKWTKEPCFRFEMIGCDPDQGPAVDPLTTTKSPFLNPGVIIGRRKRRVYYNRPANKFP